ncbi:hypothetical protein ACFOD4_19170 [Pseudoroseomonas globiformis]|uniref:DUF502 domain-containing protein n=1 Tax=Teichococcus globiformis TaxID=2307229 RepID=A0ABV7G6N3_9PROT
MRNLNRALIEGALVVVPIGAVVLLILSIVNKLRDVSDPLSGTFLHPMVMAIFLFVALCLTLGLIIRARTGRRAKLALERMLFEKLPGYRLVKAFAGNGPFSADGGSVLRPALVSIEEGLCPALIMDSFADGRLLIFVPGSPAPMSGALYIFTPDRVTSLDVPLLPFMKAISSWGLGLKELIDKSS